MARLRETPREEVTFSLFPFLSVLACVIGTLTLLIAAIALGQVADGLSRSQAIAEQNAQSDARRGEMARLQGQLAASAALLAKLDSLREQIGAAEFQSSAGGAPQASAEALTRRETELRKHIASLEQESDALDAGLSALADELDNPPTPPDPTSIEIQPLGAQQSLVPFFAECRGEGLRLRLSNGEWSLPLDVDDIVDGPKLSVFLTKVRKIPQGTIIFLIRPSGIETYRKAVRYTDRLRVRNGKLALAGNGELDFSLF